MLRLMYFATTLLLCLCLLLTVEARAYAYTDPGSSLLLLQGISSVGLGVMYFLRRRLKSLMSKIKGE